jgi:uncharacterized membrane protein YcaP (DUF421 family)
LNQQLLLQGVHKLDDVFFAELQSDGTVYIDKKTDHE